jgi:hypothetical protein
VLLLNVHAWQKRNDDAREADQQVLDERLHDLDTNQQQLVEALSKLSPVELMIMAEFTVPRSRYVPE